MAEQGSTAESDSNLGVRWGPWALTSSASQVLDWAKAYQDALAPDVPADPRLRGVVLSEHVLMGMLHVHGKSGVVRQLLESFDLAEFDLDGTLRRTPGASLPPTRPVSAGSFTETTPLSPQAYRILDRAAELARQHGATDDLLRERDILGGILVNQDSVAYQGLAATVVLHLDLRQIAAAYGGFLHENQGSEANLSQWLRGFGRGARSQADTPVGIEGDLLQYRRYANALALLASATPPPFAVGIYGDWGTGKSSLLRMIQDRLDEAFRPASVQGRIGRLITWSAGVFLPLGLALGALSSLVGVLWRRRREPELISIPFNAWAHGDSRLIWARLVERIYEEMEARLRLRPWHYFAYVGTRSLSNALYFLRARAPALVLAAATALTPWLLTVLLGADRAATIGAATVGGGAGLVVALESFGRSATGTLKELIRSDTLGKEGGGLPDRINSDLSFLYRAVTGRKMKDVADEQELLSFGSHGPPPFRVVVLVDDLDRCPPDKAVEVLEALKLVLSQPFLIAFIAADTRVLVKAIEERYQEKLPPTVHPGGPGMEYLEKIVQIPVWMPPAEMRRYVDDLLAGRSPSSKPAEDPRSVPAARSVLATWTSWIRRVLSWGTRASGDVRLAPPDADALRRIGLRNPPRIIPTQSEAEQLAGYWHYFSSSPRGAKRIVNLFRLSKALAASMAGPPLDEAATTKLIRLIILGDRWPDFWLHTYDKFADTTSVTLSTTLLSLFPDFEADQATKTNLHSDVMPALKAERRLLRHFLSEEPLLTIDDVSTLGLHAVNLPRSYSLDSLAVASARSLRARPGQSAGATQASIPNELTASGLESGSRPG